MEVAWAKTIGIVMTTLAVIWGWRFLNWIWLKPKKLERLLRKQGFQGNPYRILNGDSKENQQMNAEAKSKPIKLSDNITKRVNPYILHSLHKHGNKSFIWFGPKPTVMITNPEIIKQVLNKDASDFTKTQNPILKFIVTGVANLNGEQWHKHRRLLNPAFHLEKLKIMTPAFVKSCNDMTNKWEEMLGSDESCEIDVWPVLKNLASDVIARAAFGNTHEEGRRIFELQNEQASLVLRHGFGIKNRILSYFPTAAQRRMRKIDKDINASLTEMIKKRLNELKAGEATKNDLLGLLLESTNKEFNEQRNNKKVVMSLEDIIEECKVFYFAGQVTTTALLAWSMVLLSHYPEWQERARYEVLQVFGNKKPDFDGINNLKIMKMILNEVLRLYPPATAITREVPKDVKVGNIILPAGVEVYIPLTLIHHDPEVWGDDADQFNPERFSKGLLKATNERMSFFPFGWGPRICIGQNFSLLEANMALSMILQRFSFKLSPSYVHAPTSLLTVYPQYGIHIILRKVKHKT